MEVLEPFERTTFPMFLGMDVSEEMEDEFILTMYLGYRFRCLLEGTLR